MCNEELNDDDGKITCVECEYSYHLGTCSGLSESTFKSRNDASRRTWRCQTCRVGKSKSGQGAKSKKEPELFTILVDINRKLDSLMTLKDTVAGIALAVQTMSDKYDDVLQSLGRHEKEIGDLKKKKAGGNGKEIREDATEWA